MAKVTKMVGLAAAVQESMAYEAIRTAQLHMGGKLASSAAVALADAEACFNKGKFVYAYGRAVDSLAYSVGVFSPIYQAVVA